MNKIITGLVVSSVLLTSCGQKEITQVSEKNISPSTPNLEQEVMKKTTVLAANYEEYNAASIGEAESTVLFFHAPYCGSCTAIDKNLKETGIQDGVKVLKVDFDTATDLKKQYGVTQYHTFVQIDAEGNEIKKWSGSMKASDITEKLDGEKMMKDETILETSTNEMIKKDDIENTEETTEKTEEVVVQEEIPEKQIIVAGTFANYSPERVGRSKDTVIFFHAGWCPSCVALEKGITAWDIPYGLTILKADYDNETELKKKYGVLSQHTLVQVDADGNEIKKWAGWNTLDSIVEKVN